MVYFFRGKYDLLKKFESIGKENCAISEITLAELVYGAEYSADPEKNHAMIAQFIEEVLVISVLDAIPTYGKEKARLRRAGMLIGDLDLLIGSTALANEMVMVTENMREFERLAGLKAESWVER